MAAAAYTTPSGPYSTDVNPVLLADYIVRQGLYALSCQLVEEMQAIGVADAPAELDAAFQRTMIDIRSLDGKIMAVAPASVRDLQMQAEICRWYCSDGDVAPDLLAQLFANIAALAA